MKPAHRIAILALLAAITFVAYLPALSAGFVWDDDDWLTDNPDVSEPGGLARIWTGPVRIQYYPMLFTVFRAQHALWGYEPAGYHAVNVALHAINAFLVGLILLRLEVRGAWWVAALFALHPVHVESVAWVTELKNVLSGLFYLATVLCFLSFDRSRRAAPYCAALVLFAAAMLSKTASATLPVALVLLLLYRRRRLAGRDLVGLAPFFALALGLALVTVSLEEGLIDAVRADFELGPLQRAGVAARALVFYPWKLLAPHPLIFNYPRWNLGGGVIAVTWPFVPLAVFGFGLWAAWRRGFCGAVIAVAFYVVTIAPALGFFNVYAFRYSYVADHFQYLASVGILVLAVQAGYLIARRSSSSGSARAAAAVMLALLALLGALTFRQVQAYRDLPTLWRDTLSKNADSWIAHHNLAVHYLDEDRPDDALRHFDEAVRCKPHSAESFSGRGMALARLSRQQEALRALDRAVELAPQYAQARLQRGLQRTRSGQFAGAVTDLDLFLQANPGYLPALGARATSLAGLGRHEDALIDLDAALASGAGLQGHLDRATVLLRLGRLDLAAVDVTEALRLAPTDPRGYLLQGLLAREGGGSEQACAAWAQACRLGACDLFRRHCD